MKILINSVPKSGTHILIQILEILNYKRITPGVTSAIIRGESNKYKKALFSENGYCIDLDDLTNKIKQQELEQILDKLTENTFICGHVPYSVEMDNLLQKMGIKVLYIYRDPRDILFSYYNHQRNFPNYPFHDTFIQKSFEDSYQYILDGMKKDTFKLAPLKERVSNSTKWINSKNVLSIKFEDIIGLKGGGTDESQLKTLKEILNYLSIKKSSTDTYELANNIFSKTSFTFHKGKINAWSNELLPSSKTFINNHLKTLLNEMDYKI